MGFGEVVPIREFLIGLIQAGVRKSPMTTTLEAVKEGVVNTLSEQGVQLENKYVEIINACIFARREELRKVLT